jgi:hypothetical protein
LKLHSSKRQSRYAFPTMQEGRQDGVLRSNIGIQLVLPAVTCGKKTALVVEWLRVPQYPVSRSCMFQSAAMETSRRRSTERVNRAICRYNLMKSSFIFGGGTKAKMTGVKTTLDLWRCREPNQGRPEDKVEDSTCRRTRRRRIQRCGKECAACWIVGEEDSSIKSGGSRR